ncbi:MAG: hypothetical protein ABSB40_04210 [Nitrososphaeria archaeon]
MPELWDQSWGSLHVFTILVAEPIDQHKLLLTYLRVDNRDQDKGRQKEKPIGGHKSEGYYEGEGPQVNRIPNIVVRPARHQCLPLPLQELRRFQDMYPILTKRPITPECEWNAQSGYADHN